MKPFAGIDLTENKKNETPNGDEFLTAKPPEALSQAIDTSGGEALDMLLVKTKLPLGLRIIKWVCAFLALFTVAAVTAYGTADENTTLPEGLRLAYADMPWLFYLGAAFIIVWAVISIAAHRKEKSVSESDESKNLMDRVNTLAENILGELGVPADAANVDVLSFTYKIKKGEAVPCERALDTTPFTAFTYKAFRDGENLHLADADGKYSFPLSSIRTIRKINKRISMLGWCKDEDPDKGEYKKYKMTVDQYGNVWFKPYYVLELERAGEIWGIYFPCYELDVFEKLTGIGVEQ